MMSNFDSSKLFLLSSIFLVFVNLYNAQLYNLTLEAESDLITNLPGLKFKPNFRHFAGYLQGPTPNQQFFYWFVESQDRPTVDPLVLWLNGGPGCSSLLGAVSENGPFTLDQHKGLAKNVYSWNQHANVLYLEAPVGVGFSYDTDGKYKTDDDITSKNSMAALRSFLKKYPMYEHHDFFMTGESYAGVYLPTLAKRVIQDKTFKLKSVAIGNALSNYDKNDNSLIHFAFNHGLVSTKFWYKIKKACCKNQPEDRCQFTQSSSLMCQFLVNKINTRIYNGLNIYNLYGPCVNGVDYLNEDDLNQVDITDEEENEVKELLKNGDLSAVYPKFARIRNIPEKRGHSHLFLKNAFAKYERSMRNTTMKLTGSNEPCTDSKNLEQYFNDPKVKMALHVRSASLKWTDCSDEIFNEYGRIYTDMSEHYKYILQRKIPMLVYNGDVDMACNYLGEEWYLDDLGMKLKSKYRPWFFEDQNKWKQVGGWTKQWTKFGTKVTFATVRGSGHMVPTDRPAAAYRMFTRFLAGKNL